MVHPAANAGATLRVIIALGKFHGVIAATTPIGCLMEQLTAHTGSAKRRLNGNAIDALALFSKPFNE